MHLACMRAVFGRAPNNTRGHTIMANTLETIEHGGYVGEIFTDDYPENPREMGDCFAASLTQLSDRYAQPDDTHDARIITAWQRGYGWRADGSRGSGRGYSPDTDLVERYARVCLGAVAVEWWDDPRGSSRIFGYVTAERAAELGITDPAGALHAELREYAAWCQGDVYGYSVTAPDGETIDSCCGFYGDDSLPYVRSEIRESIDRELATRHAQHVDMFKRLLAHGRAVFSVQDPARVFSGTS